jgi:hypothetical protein
MFLSCECCVFSGRSLRRADHSSRGVLPSVVCLGVIVRPPYRGGPGPVGAVAPWRGEGGEIKNWVRILFAAQTSNCFPHQKHIYHINM